MTSINNLPELPNDLDLDEITKTIENLNKQKQLKFHGCKLFTKREYLITMIALAWKSFKILETDLELSIKRLKVKYELAVPYPEMLGFTKLQEAKLRENEEQILIKMIHLGDLLRTNRFKSNDRLDINKFKQVIKKQRTKDLKEWPTQIYNKYINNLSKNSLK